ncbi:hypothetical protein [Marinomonas balearica]|uniref:Uncharacterized protein n=1 Tax=Marinomonas balearica TaxID=491947 RepID=A0A4V3CGD6_9GAMM|nr:hypothetical protein [Marinomonas balearica]TDO97202.1 hypothetical protein DFP79_2014 [Marinomonas balearica]
MKNIVNDCKISDFRDLVNSNSKFVYQIYKDKGGKNLFHLVCSCMDWISVSVRHLENVAEFDSNIDVKCMQVYSLISSIDLISESVTQLHRVFVNEKTVPFKNEKSCFRNRLIENEDDNTYFTTLRACFGAHSVSLNQSGSKRFASWPFKSRLTSADLTVHLYSREVNEQDLTLNLYINELLEFLATRYDYLDVITTRIQSLFEEYRIELSKQLIEIKSDPLEQLYVLRSESDKRLDNDYYRGEIDDLIMIFEAKVNDAELTALAEDYKNSLLPTIEEIKSNLQSMSIIDLKTASDLRSRSELSRELSYELSKFYSWIYSGRYDPMLDYYFERLNAVTEGKFKFSESDTRNLTFLKVKLMLTA